MAENERGHDGTSKGLDLSSIPIDADIEQLVKSLGDSVDTSKVSDVDIDKLLGSLNADFSTSLGLPSVSAGAANGADPLALLSHTFGIGLDSLAGRLATSGPESSGLLGGPAFSSNQQASLGTLASQASMLDAIQGRTQPEMSVSSAAAHPGTPDAGIVEAYRSGTSTPFSGSQRGTPDASASQPPRGVADLQQQQYRVPNSMPQQLSASPSMTVRPQSSAQRPVRPQRPAQGARPMPRPRPQAPDQQHQQQRPPRPMAPGLVGAGPRPSPPRQPVRPGAGTGDSTDPSTWLAATMSMLPVDQQGRLANLFRGLQSKAIDFPSFMREAEAIMGSKFQDMLALMRNQGPRPAHTQQPPQPQQQQRPPRPGRPQPLPSTAHRVGASMAATTPPARVGMQHPPSTSSPLTAPSPGLPHASLAPGMPPQGLLAGQPGDSSRGYALARQLLAQQAGGHPGAAGGLGAPLPGSVGGTPFEAVISRWRQIILNPAIPGEQLAKLSMQLSAYGEHLARPSGPATGVSEEERSQQFSQISKLQALIAQRQFVRGPATPTQPPEGRPESPLTDSRGKDPKQRSTAIRSMNDAPAAKAKKRPGDPLRQGSPVPRTAPKKLRTAADWNSEADLGLHGQAGPSRSVEGVASSSASHGSGLSGFRDDRGSSHAYTDEYDPMDISHSRRAASRASTAGTGGHASDDGGDDGENGRPRTGDRGRGLDGSRENQYRARDRRDRERHGAASGGSDMFAIGDVMGYAGVNLREESEMILGGGMHHHDPHGSVVSEGRADDRGPELVTRVVGNVAVARDRTLRADFANTAVLEALVAKICQSSHIRAVAADVVPCLTLALQERLRSFMELVSAAAYHRTRTQTLPPPPLDPSTRLPLYKITPHLDVKKQLQVIERVDQLREQARQQRLTDREQRNVMDRLQPSGNNGSGAGSGSGDGDDGAARAGDDQTWAPVPPPADSAAIGSSTDSAAAARDGEAGDHPQHPPGSGGNGADPTRSASAAAAAAAKRPRKKDDDSPAYTSKNMPEEMQNKISNMTALRAAGGVRKAWMNSSSPSWLRGAPTANSAGAPTDSAPRLPPTPATADAAPWSGVASPTAHGSGELVMEPGTGDGADGSAPTQPAALRAQAPMLAHRSVTLAAPLLVTVRDCLFSLERERLGSVRVGRGGGDRVLIQAFSRFGHE